MSMLGHNHPPPDEPLGEALDDVALCRDAFKRSVAVAQGYFGLPEESFTKATRGSAEEAFARQVVMSALVVELGFSPLTVGKAIGRDKATVDHACRVIEVIRGALDVDDLVTVLGFDGVTEFLGGLDGAEKFLESAERQIDGLFAAMRLCAVEGAAYCAEARRRKAAAVEKVRG